MGHTCNLILVIVKLSRSLNSSFMVLAEALCLSASRCSSNICKQTVTLIDKIWICSTLSLKPVFVCRIVRFIIHFKKISIIWRSVFKSKPFGSILIYPLIHRWMPRKLYCHAFPSADIIARLVHLRRIFFLLSLVSKHLQYFALSFHLSASDTNFFTMCSLLFARLPHVTLRVHQLPDINAACILLL